MRISHNIDALKVKNRISINQKVMDSKTGKLSSGMRINCAADDAAGLSISERMRALIRGMNQAARNIQDGISFLDTADSALGSIQDPSLQRMRELSIQAVNDTLTNNDRCEIQQEVQQIKDELRGIFSKEQFNTQNIFVQDIDKTKKPISGMLAGDTVIRQYGLQVVSGKNDVFSFRVDGEYKEIRLDAGNYNADQLVEHINFKFKNAGTDVKVTFSWRIKY